MWTPLPLPCPSIPALRCIGGATGAFMPRARARSCGRGGHCRRRPRDRCGWEHLASVGFQTRWDIYRASAKARLIGTVEAPDAEAAIKVAAKEYNLPDPRRLIAVRRP